MGQSLLCGLLFLSLIVAVSCHTNMISVNGDRSCVRLPDNNSPLMDIYSGAMRCNNKNSPAGGRCGVNAGSEMTLRWFHDGSNGIIDPSHKGPIAVYLAEAGTGGNGDSWFKISEDGFNGEWGVIRLVQSGGNYRVRIPNNIRPGDYIVRTELIAHHESFKSGGAQYYVGCADIRINGGGGGDCGPKVSIPGGGWVPNYDDPTVKVNIYNGLNGYRVPGPGVANCAGGGGGGNPPPPPPQQNNGGGGGGGEGLDNGAVYLLRAGHSRDKCLDAGGDQNGASIQIYGCWEGASNQRWKLENRGDGWSLIEQRSHRALDVWQSHQNGAQTQLWSFGGAPNQLWYPERQGDGSYSFKGKFSGKYLDVAGQSNQNGARVHQWDGTGAGNQRWFLQRV